MEVPADTHGPSAGPAPSRRRTKGPLALATWCGMAPLVAGCAVMVWWWQTRSPAAVRAGAWTLTIGAALFLLGSAALVFRLLIPPRPAFRRAALPIVVLVADVLVAWAFAEIVHREVTLNEVVFINRSGAALEDLAVLHGDRIVGTVRLLERGQEAAVRYSARRLGEGAVSFSGRLGRERIGGSLGVTAAPNRGRRVRVSIEPGGKYAVPDARARAAAPEGEREAAR